MELIVSVSALCLNSCIHLVFLSEIFFIFLSSRAAKVAIPATSAGQKVPVVFHLHGKKSRVECSRFKKESIMDGIADTSANYLYAIKIQRNAFGFFMA